MKRSTSGLDRKAEDDCGESSATITAPFAENRYRKYRFRRESIMLEAPESSGVYGLYNAVWIYIGEGDNIRSGLLTHFAGDHPCINRHKPSGFAFELVPPEDRFRRREELVNELQPTCRREASQVGRARTATPDVGSVDRQAGVQSGKILGQNRKTP